MLLKLLLGQAKFALARQYAVAAKQEMENDHVMTLDMLGMVRGMKTGETAWSGRR